MANILFSIIAGIVTGLGMGGGIILIFLLTTVSGISQHIAQGANLIFFIPTCLISIIINLKNKNIDLKTAVIVMGSGIIGAVVGAKISVNASVDSLRKYFGVFLLIIAIFEIFSLIKSNKNLQH